MCGTAAAAAGCVCPHQRAHNNQSFSLVHGLHRCCKPSHAYISGIVPTRFARNRWVRNLRKIIFLFSVSVFEFLTVSAVLLEHLSIIFFFLLYYVLSVGRCFALHRSSSSSSHRSIVLSFFVRCEAKVYQETHERAYTHSSWQSFFFLRTVRRVHLFPPTCVLSVRCTHPLVSIHVYANERVCVTFSFLPFLSCFVSCFCFVCRVLFSFVIIVAFRIRNLILCGTEKRNRGTARERERERQRTKSTKQNMFRDSSSYMRRGY